MEAMFKAKAVKIQADSQQLADHAEHENVDEKLQPAVVLSSMHGTGRQFAGPAGGHQHDQKTEIQGQVTKLQETLDAVVLARAGAIWLETGIRQAHGW